MPPPTRQPGLRGKVLRFAAGVIVLVLLGGYLLANREALTPALRINWTHLLLVSLGVWLVILVRAFQIRALLGALRSRAGIVYLMAINVATSFLNLLPVRVGVAMGAVWLRRQCGLRYARFLSLAVATIGLGLVTSGAFGLIGTVSSTRMSTTSRAVMAVICGLGVVVPTLLCLVPGPARPVFSGRFRRGLRRFVLGLRRIVRQRAVLWQSLLAQAGQYLLRCARLYLIFRVCGFEIDLPGILVVQSLIYFSTFAMVTPGGLGVREGAIAVAAEWTGAGFDAGLVVAAVDRAVWLFWIVALGTPATYWLMHQTSPTEAKAGGRALPESV
ncbi:MAG: flippase-like domain-containing protein [Phycisphaerae bacterium]|nr:flippase-like domain-containing protein [Phycisphaerae bacterium]